MIKRALKKAQSQMGESIGETLIALLIAALALMMLAGAIGSAANIVTRNKTSMNDYYQTDQRKYETDWDGKVDTAWTNMDKPPAGQTPQQSQGGETP